MPCNDYRDDQDYRYSITAKELQDVRKNLKGMEAVLCGVFTILEKDGNFDKVIDNVDWKEVGVSKRQVTSWWTHHKEEDEKRRIKEAEELKKKQIAKLAKDKLSPEEYRAIKEGW